MSTFKTTHDERVEMLREETTPAMNGMWATLILKGTQVARDAFVKAALEAGWKYHITLGWERIDR